MEFRKKVQKKFLYSHFKPKLFNKIPTTYEILTCPHVTLFNCIEPYHFEDIINTRNVFLPSINSKFKFFQSLIQRELDLCKA